MGFNTPYKKTTLTNPHTVLNCPKFSAFFFFKLLFPEKQNSCSNAFITLCFFRLHSFSKHTTPLGDFL